MNSGPERGPWVMVFLWDAEGRAVAELEALRWSAWPGIMVQDERYFTLDSYDDGKGEAHYWEQAVHFLPAHKEANGATA